MSFVESQTFFAFKFHHSLTEEVGNESYEEKTWVKMSTSKADHDVRKSTKIRPQQTDQK